MAKTLNSCAAAFFAALLLSAGAQAQSGQTQTPTAIFSGKSGVEDDAALPAKGGKIQFGQASAIPSGYFDMCVQHPNLCRVQGGRLSVTGDGSVKLTSATMQQLNSVNANVNATIHPAYRDDWTPGQRDGDCKDFAMTKRQHLVASGWPTSALPVAIVRTSFGELHLILVARTSQGDFVLDNLTDSIVPWTQTRYSWEKIQSTTNAFAWRAL